MEGVLDETSPGLTESAETAPIEPSDLAKTVEQKQFGEDQEALTNQPAAAGSEVDIQAVPNLADVAQSSSPEAHGEAKVQPLYSEPPDQAIQAQFAELLPAQQQLDWQEQKLQDTQQQLHKTLPETATEPSAALGSDAAASAARQPSSLSMQLSSSARSSRPSTAAGKCAKAEAAAAAAAAAEQVGGSMQHVLSLAANKRFNLHLLKDGTLVSAAGCTVLLLHIPTMQQRFLPGRDGGGIAAVAVHPNLQLFLVAEKCRSRPPNIYVYSYPDLALQHALTAGTECAYSAACFSPDGSKLAAVGSSPDYLLTLWDWQAGATLLRCKAFSQEVYSLGFCPHSPGCLVSCGTGHIRFWTMASTFTGLKLQGALGRFGGVELSDVAVCVELPDGKVLSGSEAGDLLLWEGGLIKAVISRPGGVRCHTGPVEVLLHDTQTNYLLSGGGGDGLIQLWDVAKVQEAEPPEGSNTVEIKPAVSVTLPTCSSSSSNSSSSGRSSSGATRDGSAGVRGLVWLDRRTWLVQSEAGALFKVNVPLNMLDPTGYSVSTLMQLQAGGVVGCSTCPDRHVLLTAAGHGTISAIDYRSQSVLQQLHFGSRISCMAMLPATADPQQRHVLLGFADGSVRLVARCSDGWAVLAEARPHKVQVASLAVSSTARSLAAVAEDGAVFFMLLGGHNNQKQQQQQQQFEPLVACQLGDVSPSCCCWSADGIKLLVGCGSGVAVEVTLPAPGTLDTSTTYQHQLHMRHFTVKPPQLRQQRYQQQQQQQQQQQPEAPNAAAAEAGTAAGCSSSADTPGSDADAAAANSGAEQPSRSAHAPDQQQQQAEQPTALPPSQELVAAAEPAEGTGDHPPLPITCIAYQPGSSDVCLLWLGGSAAGQVLTCSWATHPPTAVSTDMAVAGAAVSVAASCWSGAYKLFGTADGQVRLEETGPAPRSWQCALHDMHNGLVTGLAMAFDHSCLVSAAADGTLLLLHNPLGPPTTAAAVPQEPNAGLPTVAAAVAGATSSEGPAATAATSPAAAALSLEEAKQAMQRDQQAATAAAAKQQLVAAVEVLRQELAVMLREEEGKPPAARLPAEAFHLDQGLPAMVQREREQRLAAAHAQVAYDAEVAALKLAKLQAYFNSTLAEHVVSVQPLAAAAAAAAAAIGGGGGRSRSVSTFRPPELPREVVAALTEAEAEEAQRQEQRQQAGTRSHGKLTRSSQSVNYRGSQRASKSSFKARVSQEVLGPDASKAGSTSTATPPSRADAWRLAKKQRAAEWAAFNASRPDDTYDAPEDIAAVKQAAATIGDFKLKSDPGFMLPEDERWTPAKKRHQMLQLMRQLSAARSNHNEQVVALRQRKRDLVTQLNSMQARLAVVNGQLGVTDTLPQHAMLPEEEPEQQLMHVSEAQLTEHAAAQKAAAEKAAGFGALGGFAAAAGGPGKAHAPAGTKVASPPKQQQQGSGVAGLRGSSDGLSCVRKLGEPERHRLQVEKEQLAGAVSSLQSCFNAAVAALRSTQLQLAVDLKAAEGRMLMMLKELALLKDAESKELALEAKRAAKVAEAEEMAARLAELEAQLDDKRAEGQEAAARKAAVIGELEVLLAEQDGYKDALTKVFYRRIKRAKKHGPGSTGSGGGSSNDDSDDGSSDYGDGDGSGSDNSGSDEVCPPGCDPVLYDSVVELREHRLDEEDVAAEVAKALEALGKDKMMLAKKAKLVDTALTAINQEVLDFQIDKQARLNQLPATVSLYRHQLPLLDTTTTDVDAGTASAGAATTAGSDIADGGVLPADLSEAIVFSSHALELLKHRMQELDQERDDLKQQQKELKHQHKQMQEDKAAKELKLADLTAHCTAVQMLKFGQVIDANMLDGIGVRNKTADELREVLKGQATYATRELTEWDARIAAKRRDLLALLRENTAALTTVTDLTHSHRELEARVMAGRHELWQDPLSSRRAAMAERDSLVSRISSQANHLESLRLQLAAMRRKDSAIHG